MARKTTYKRLILKIILVTLTITLSIAFLYVDYMKRDAIEKLTKIDAKKTTELVFQSLYSAMERGWDRSDLERIINRINTIDQNMSVNVYRTEEVAKEYGDIPKDFRARENNKYVKQALNNDDTLNIVDDNAIDYYYPITAKKECLKCHTQTQEGNVLGVINITYPIEDLKVSLSAITNFFILFIVVFSLVIFFALFIKVDKYLIEPIKKFIININAISQHKDITKRIDENNQIHEIDSMQDVFNQMLDSLEYQFYNDELTRLPNRKRLIETVSKNENAILMIINIDKFQQINDLYSDKIGNDILKETADIIQDNIAPNSLLFKLHADEYALYYPTVLAYEELKHLAIHLNKVIENHIYRVNDSEIFINATIGVASGSNFLLNNADIALKLAKKKKKNYLIYDSSMNIEHEYEQNIKWGIKIKDAIKNDKIEPLFQPIVDLKTKEIVKYEALMRMIDDNGDYISPFHFLELAKKNKLYPELTKIMIEKTFEAFKDREHQVSINLSVEDILNESVYKIILDKLREYKMGHKIVFEIIESEGIENFEEVLDFIKKAKSSGAKISIDDFGTGYSNFEYLMKLKVDYIKIDASMIKNIDVNRDSQLVTETILDFAKKMNIKTVAEFIHSESVCKKVSEIGIDYGQGYYFGEPAKLP